jgi:hypothetical protein
MMHKYDFTVFWQTWFKLLKPMVWLKAWVWLNELTALWVRAAWFGIFKLSQYHRNTSLTYWWLEGSCFFLEIINRITVIDWVCTGLLMTWTFMLLLGNLQRKTVTDWVALWLLCGVASRHTQNRSVLVYMRQVIIIIQFTTLLQLSI